jgi:hypothetical protein
MNAGKASAARADEFAESVRPHVRVALTDAACNLTRAAAILNAGKQLTVTGQAWDRRSVAAVARRLRLI